MTAITETAAEHYLAERALTPSPPGFVGLEVDLPLSRGSAEPTTLRLRHGMLVPRVSGRLCTVSGPPSPGLEVAVDRMREDLSAATARVNVTAPDETPHAAIRVNLEAGTDDDSPYGLYRRWAVAQAIAPVLAAAFANTPARSSGRIVWRSARQASRLHVLADHTDPDPRIAWARQVLDAPVTSAGRPRATLRHWINGGHHRSLTFADLDRHILLVRPPVAARGRLEIDVADRQADDDWIVPAAVVTALVEDPAAAAEAMAATTRLSGTPRLWERAARHAMRDADLAAAARSLFVSAYASLARRGAPRPMRDAVAAFTERFVLRGRCPADDVIDRTDAIP